MKKKILFIAWLLILIILVVGLIISGASFFKKKNNTTTNNKGNSINWDTYRYNENFIVYLYDKKDNSPFVTDIIKYYEDVYKISFDKLELSNFSDKGYKSLLEDLSLDDDNSWLPLLYVKKNNEGVVVRNLLDEDILKESLVKYQYIGDDVNRDIRISNDLFDEVYNKNQDSLIYCGVFSNNYYKYRKYLATINDNFTFYSGNIGEAGSDHMFTTFSENISELSDNKDKDIIAIVGDGKIKKYQVINNTNDIDVFLKTNGYL